MGNKKFAVLGATGKIGHVLVEELLQKGHQVRAIGRDDAKLEGLKKKGAEIYAADFNNVGHLAEAFSGCDGIFTMITPDYSVDDNIMHQNKSGEVIVDAIIKSKVTKVLNLSSIGAQHADKTGPIKGLYKQEQRLNAISNVDVLHLRPSSFMQNFFWSVPVIQHHGIISSSVKSDLPMWMVSTNDIGKKAASLLADLSFTGKSVFEFVGPRELTQAQATEILGKSIGQHGLKYIQSSYEDEIKALVGAGMKSGFVQLMVEMRQGMNEGLIAPTQSLSSEHKGSISFETFAQEFSEVYRA